MEEGREETEREGGEITARVGKGHYGECGGRRRWKKEGVEARNVGRGGEKMSRRRVGDPLEHEVRFEVGRASEWRRRDRWYENGRCRRVGWSGWGRRV